MRRFGYLAVKKGFTSGPQFVEGIKAQLEQENDEGGESTALGQILVEKGFMTEEQRDEVLRDMVMEPHARWGMGTHFVNQLSTNREAKQAVGEHVGRELVPSADVAVFLGHSSSVYYAFLGMVKHERPVQVLTTNAAILSAFPALPGRIKSLNTPWRGRVDVDTAKLEPHDRGDLDAARVFEGELNAALVGAFISAAGFDPDRGPLYFHPGARYVALMVLRSAVPTHILIDPSKIRLLPRSNLKGLLFGNQSEWRQVRKEKDIKVVTMMHPRMPAEQADLGPAKRNAALIEDSLKQDHAPAEEIEEVLTYHDWARRMGEMLIEVPKP